MFTVPSETCALGDSCPAHTIPSPCPSPGKGSGWLIPHVAGRPPFSGDGLSMAPAPRWEAPGLPVGFAGKDSLKCGQDRHWLSGQGLPPRSAHNPTASPLCSREVAAGGPDRGERGVAGLRWAEPGLQSGHSGGTSSPLHSSVSPSLSERHSETPPVLPRPLVAQVSWRVTGSWERRVTPGPRAFVPTAQRALLLELLGRWYTHASAHTGDGPWFFFYVTPSRGGGGSSSSGPGMWRRMKPLWRPKQEKSV